MTGNPFDQFDREQKNNPFDQFDDPPERTLAGTIKDAGVSAAKGLAGAGEAAIGLADIATGGRAGKALDSIGMSSKVAREFYDSQYSPAQQAANRSVEEAEGFGGTVKAYLQNPSTILHQTIETIPAMVGGGIAGAGLKAGALKFAPKLAGKVAPKTLGVMGGAAGEGLVGAGMSAEQIRQQNPNGTITGKQAIIAGASGLGTSIFGFVGGRLAQKFGLTDIDTLIANSGVDNTVKKFGVKEITKRIVGGGISEGMFEELPQSIQEQIWQNAALNKPLLEGVPESAASGLVLGGVMGAGANLLPSRQPAASPPPTLNTAANDQQALADTVGIGQETAADPNNQPTSLDELPQHVGTDGEKRFFGPENNLGGEYVSGDPEAFLPPEEPVGLVTRVAQKSMEILGPPSTAQQVAQTDQGATRQDPVFPDYSESEANDLLYDLADQAQVEQDLADSRKRRNDFENMQQEEQAIQRSVAASKPVEEPDPGLDKPVPMNTPLDIIAKDYGREVSKAIRAAWRDGEEISVVEAIKRVTGKETSGTEIAGEFESPLTTGESNATEKQAAPEAGQEESGKTKSAGRNEGIDEGAGSVGAEVGKPERFSEGPQLSGVAAHPVKTNPVVVNDAAIGEAQAENTPFASTTPAASAQQESISPSISPSMSQAPVSAKGPGALVEHTTKKGKVIRGMIRKDLTLEQAKKIDQFAFKKDGGVFIREKYLEQPAAQEAKAEEAPAAQEAEPATTTPKEAKQDDWFDDKGEFTLQGAREHLRRLEDQRSEFERTEIAAGRVPIFDARKEQKIREAKELVAQIEKEGGKKKVTGGSETPMEVIDEIVSKNGGILAKVLKNPDTGKFHVVGIDTDSGKEFIPVKIFDEEYDAAYAAWTVAGKPESAAAAEERKKSSKINLPSSKSNEEKQEVGFGVQLDSSAKSSKSDEGSNKVTDQFADNKIFTSDAVAAARARLKAKRNTLRSGFDPELMQDMVILGGAYFEAGIRKFADWSKAILSDIGQEFKPFLRGTYENLRYYPGLETTGMNSPEFVGEYLSGDQDVKKDTEDLISSNNSDTVKGNGGANDEQLQTDGSGVPAAARPGRPEADGERGGTGGVPGGDREGLPGDGKNDLQANDGKPAGRRPEKKAGGKPGSGRSQGDIDKLPERVPDQPVGANYTITDADNLGKGGAKTKARDNIRAIEILKELRQTGKPATKEQQAALVKYVGWGASELANNIFPTKKWDTVSRKYVDYFKDEWRELGEKLKGLLSESEYAEAQGSTLNAHYTSQDVIESMYRALERFGFDGKGRILEPGCGIGNFIGLLPEKFQQARFTGVEMDPTTAGIASLLYPRHDVRTMDFADFKAPNNFYDIAIGNPPFLDVKVTGDPDYAKQKFLVHDFFFAKSIDKVRPGGLLMLVTSKGTMDKANDRARTYLSKRADLIGAIRLPQTAFKENAGTEVVTDVIFLRKRADGEQTAGESWAELREVSTRDGDTVYVNEYFANHPEMVLGHHSTKGTMYGPGQYTVEPKDASIVELFNEAVKTLPENIYKRDAGRAIDKQDRLEVEFAPDTIKEGGFFLKDGDLFQKENGVGRPVSATGGKKAIIRDFIKLRDAVRNVLYVQMTGDDPTALKTAQKELNKAYDGFVALYGHINKHRSTTRTLKDGTESTSTQYINFSQFKSDPDAYLVASIERYDLDTGEAKKADIFTERVIDSPREPKIDTATDALHVSLYRTGGVDLPLMAELLGQPERDILSALEDLIFMDPDGHRWVTSDEYLSGNVKKKLAEAKAAVEVDKKFQKNVEALEKIQPEDLPQSRIDVNLGMPLFDPEHIVNFSQDVLEMGISASYLSLDGSWKIDPFSGHGAAKATSDYGTGRANASSLLEAALNNITPKIFDYDENHKAILNKDETEAAVEKLKKIRKAFKEWVWSDQRTAETIARRFNDQYNNTVKREFGGEYLKQMQFPGLSKVKNPFEHQRRVAWRIIQRGNTYMAHSVGAGKTIASIIAGQEMKRLGIKKKPVWVVPGHMLKQFAGEFLELYPAAKILVADEEQFSKENRNRFMGRVASENWDGIIITHSAFGKIPMSADFQGQFIDEQLQDIELLLADSAGDRMKRKQLERLKKRLEARLKKVLDAANKDKGVNFEETGIDQIFVDEAHEFRKLDFSTNQTDIRGIDPAGSMRAFDLYVKTKYLETLAPGRSLVMMSGTPITNTLGEVYSIQRFLQEDKLRDLGLNHFDSWAATFGGMVTNIEQTPGGAYKPVSRFGDFANLQSLCAMWAEIGDFVHARDLDYIKRPKIKGGGRKLIVGETDQLQRDYKKALAARVKEIESRKRPPKKGEDIILSVITDGRHAAMDDRYIDPNAPLRPDSKTAKLIDKGMEVYHRTAKERGTQMIFADLGLPSSEDKRGFSLYKFIRDQLIANGVPPNEIAFMQDYKKSDQKRKLFQDMNDGKIRFLIGSSIAMGTGVNAQKRLVALHHFDADTYLPANIEQREGRIVRQGNTNNEVEIYAYIARGSYDETMWQFLETKQRFIDDFLAGNVSVDKASDIDGAADSFAEAKALSSDNPLAIELAGVNNELSRLESLHTAFRKDQQTLAYKKEAAKAGIQRIEGNIATMERAAAKLVPTKGDSFKATISGKSYEDREAAGDALLHEVATILKEDPGTKDLGEMGGFTIQIKKSMPMNKPYVEFAMLDRETDTKTPWREIDLENLADVSAPGLVMKLENGLNDIGSRIEGMKESLRSNRRQIEEADARIGQEFEYMDMLLDKRKRRDEIEKELAAADKEETGGDVLLSQSPDTTPTGTTTGQVETELRSFLGRGFDNLVQKGKLEITQQQGDLQGTQLRTQSGTVAGVYDPKAGKVYLVADNIIADDARYVMLHEGGHALLREDKVFMSKRQRILAAFERSAETNESMQAAMSKVPADTAAELRSEEGLMYWLQDKANHQHSLFRRIISVVKAALFRLGVPFKNLTESDLVALFTQGTKAWSRKGDVAGKQDSPLFTFAGANAKGADKFNLAAAQKMEKQGIDRDQIWKTTGWWKLGNDWKFEIDDSLTDIKIEDGTLDEVLTHPQLFKNYPGIAKVRVRFEAMGDTRRGSYDPDKRLIRVNRHLTAKGKRSTLHHEVQHIIQTEEGFAAGAGMDTAASAEYWKQTGEVESRLVQRRLNMSPAARKATPPWETLDKMLRKEGLLEPGQKAEDVLISREDTDSRIVFSMAAAETYDGDLKKSAGSFYEKIHDKPDIPFLARILSTPEYYFKNFPATWKLFNAQLNRHKEKFNLENDILGDFVKVFSGAQKEMKEAYEKVKNYLLEVDASGKSYRLKREEKWEVVDNDGMIVGYTMTKREGEQVAREAAGKSGKHIKDYTPTKVETWTVIDPKGAEGDQFLDEQEAVEAMEQAEYFDMVNAGHSKDEAGLVRRFRRMTNTAFDYMIADLRKIIRETEALNLPEPTVDVPDESRRWAVLEDGIGIANFATKADAMAAIKMRRAGDKATGARAAELEAKKLSDAEIMQQVKLSGMIAMMSDLRGQYFPRQRKPGGVILRAVKGNDKIMEKFDLYLAGRKVVDAETGELHERPMSEWLRKAFNQATGFIPFVDTLEKRARQLRVQGYDIVVEKDAKTPESVFDVVHLSAAVDALLREAVGNAKKDKQGLNERAMQEVNKILTANVADLFKARGYLSSRLRRSSEYWKGFEEDPLLAGTQYAKGIASGIAKRNAAKNMMAAMTGRDQTWAEFKEQNPEGTWDEYDSQVEGKRLDPGKQPQLHREALGFMEEVLRNEEQIDRVIGTMRGLATIKFLGFRVSSAAVNLTNMIMGVPATISSQSGGSITGALKAVHRAAVQYGKYRLGKEITEDDRKVFLTITNNGWDQAQFNMENAAVLMSKVGRGWAKFCEYAMYMFGAAERANRATTIFAAYKEIIANTSLRGQEALEKAKHISDRAHGIYGKETIPSWVRGSANPLRLTYTFQKFSHNYMLNMLEMGLKGDRKQAAYMLLSPVLMGGVGSTLATPIIAMIAKGMGAGDDPEEEFYDWVVETFGSDAIARHGIPGMAGINLKGSIEMNNPIPTTMGELFGAPQAIIKDTMKAVEHAGKGEMMKAGEALLPTAIGAAIRAAREGSEGITTGSYSPVFYGDEPLRATTAEQFVRTLSFNPSRISGIREKQWHEKQVAAKYNRRRSDIIEKFKRYYIYGDGNRYELMKEFNRYNELVVGSGRNDLPKLSMPVIRRAVRRATKPSKTERLRA